MKTRYIVFLVLGLAAIFVLAFLLRDAVQEGVVIPLAHFFWLVRGYYGAVPQNAYWMLALGVAALIAIFSFRLPDVETRRQDDQWKTLPGSIHEMAFWIQRGTGGVSPKWRIFDLLHLPFTPQSHRGNVYPKWHTAHMLAELALDILDRRGTRLKNVRQVTGPDWNPPADVKKYLDAALTTNYTDYPKPKRFSRLPPTPFDQDLEPVIDYLESLLESENDHHS
jgi:hypothetical protein